MSEPINIFWFRRDLRWEDNHALYRALADGPTLAIFIFDQDILASLPRDDARVTFIHNQLEKLSGSENRIRFFHGHVLESWKTIISEYNIKGVYINKDYEPYAIKRDNDVKNLLASKNIRLHAFKDQVVFEEDEIVKNDGKPYTVYTPYRKKWQTQFTDDLLTPYPSEKFLHNLIPVQESIISLEAMDFKPSSIRVKPFTFKTAATYADTRDYPSKDETTYLSVHLRFGTISIRAAHREAKKASAVLVAELIWRSFFMQILYHFPHVVDTSFRPAYDQIKWRNNESEFEAWCQGRTGYPMVDAGMRQLNETGYMHNRVRMVTASFLCKHLLIDWRWGESYFAEKLLDFDLSANNGNWQWAAGSGCDAAPYFRVFNPIIQLKKFDKDLIYTKRWVKDLGDFSYPEPIVEHKMARERCLATYKATLKPI